MTLYSHTFHQIIWKIPMDLGTLTGSAAKLSDDQKSISIKGITSDSRVVEQGYLFAAIPGTQVDGARFIPSALEKGAVAILMTDECQVEVPDNIAVIHSSNPRHELAKFAAEFYSAQPETCIAVTGTNGKTSVASFVRQIWRGMGYHAASLGTIGLVTDDENVSSTHTTPEPVALHKMLAELKQQGVEHLALEASSHGLQQNRLDGVRIKAGAFTNISRDHLDYHDSFEDYFAQKMRLFSELLPDDAAAVIDVDSDGGKKALEICQKRGLNIIDVGEGADILKLKNITRDGHSQKLTVGYDDHEYSIQLPLVGYFQASNALVSAGLCLSQGAEPEAVFKQLEQIKGAKGRLEYVGKAKSGAAIFIDYAHTPDALETALLALKPYVENELICLFGCGGDRDKGKRPQMGKAAADYSDVVYVTDDNPRSESADQIRSEIMVAVPGASEIGDRAKAIRTAISNSKSGDVLLVAGKGHETGQIIGDQVIPFSDHDAVQDALKEE